MREVYIPAWNREFGSTFVHCCEGDRLDDILCAHHERALQHDNCVRFGGQVLQIPPDRERCHYTKARMQVLARCDAEGQLLQGAAGVAERGLRYSGP